MIVDYEKAKETFIAFTKHYDVEHSDDLTRKVGHTFKVVDNSLAICKDNNFSELQTDIAFLVALFHDLGRFDQMKIYGTFNDKKSFDHGDHAVKILMTDNYIRQYLETDEYDDIILKAVGNHNKFEVDPSITDEETILQCKIIRDADKVDIFDNAIFWYWRDEEERNKLQNSTISDFTYEAFRDHHLIKRPKEYTKLDEMLTLFAFVFDFNFKWSKEVIIEKNYVDDILGRFHFEDENIQKQLDNIRQITKEELLK